MIQSDIYRLRIILNNLISNAIKYADLSKEAPFVRISLTQDNEWHNIAVEDNGIGIEEDYQSKIFHMFYRASIFSKGSGLGLYIAKESADKMHYRIDVKSHLGRGSLFTLKIPATNIV